MKHTTRAIFLADTILPERRRTWWPRIGLAASVLVVSLFSALWWISAPLRVEAQSPSPPAGIHKVQGASFRHEAGGLLFIALLGTDVRNGPPGGGGGCDAVHIVAINRQTKGGTILNFPRDSYLNGRKITDICRSGGVEAGLNALKSHTGIDIQYYVTTEFSHFRQLINDLGGIDINIPYAMADAPSGAFFQPGPQHLDGGGALGFSRNRKDTPQGDFSRTENQGTVILASLAKFRAEMADPHRLYDYIRAARKNVKITVPLAELVRLGLLAREIDPAAIQSITIQGGTDTINGSSVVILSPGDTYDRVKDDAQY